jgi:hypothetical protein
MTIACALLELILVTVPLEMSMVGRCKTGLL